MSSSHIMNVSYGAQEHFTCEFRHSDWRRMVFRVCTLLAVLCTLVSVFCEDSFSLLSSVLTETRLSVDRCGKAGKVKLSNISDMIAPMKTLNDHCASLIYKYVLSYNNGSRLFKKGGLSRLESFFADPIHWENNLGNAMYSSANAYALHRFCGPRMKRFSAFELL